MLPKPTHCLPCPLYGGGTGFSHLEGTGDLRLLVAAEALGENEEEDGLPLRPYAQAGAVFQRALRESGIKRNDLLITNMVRCRPPGNELRGAPYEREALNHCSTYFDQAVAQHQPRAILALGDTPMRELTDYQGVLTYRGFILPSRYNIPTVATYHPALLARGALGTLYGVFRRDVNLALQVAQDGPPKQLETHYELNPSPGRVREFLDYLRGNAQLPITYDVETAGILSEAERGGRPTDTIIQIQFSCRSGQAIVLPWEGEYIGLVASILSTPNPKWGWNSRSFDDPLLRRNGVTLNGPLHDLMLAWLHLNPDFAGQRDSDTLGGGRDAKDFTARLMNLQSAVSFYAPEVGPWKHRTTDLQFYGACDADYTYRCGEGIFNSLRRQGLYDGYFTHKVALRTVLDAMGERGLPVNAAKQQEVKQYVNEELGRIQDEIQRTVPTELRALHPAQGYRTLPVKIRELVQTYDAAAPTLVEFSNFSGHLIPLNGTWAVRKLFNVGSAPQLLSYIKYRGYRVPKMLTDPTKDTTGKDELVKLAKETGDPLLNLALSYRKFATMGSRYVGGDWVPGPDGRVHGEFGWGPASAQLKCINPNLQQFPEHGDLAKRAKEMIVAEAGHTFVKVDMRGFHARTIGFLAEDAAYYKLADFDVHSYITAHYLRLPDAQYMLEMSDDELRTYLKTIKRDHEHTRNFKVKRVVHGSQFGMGVNKLYNMHGPDLDPTVETAIEAAGAKWYNWSDTQRTKFINTLGRAEAAKLMQLMRDLFPLTFDDKNPRAFPYKIAQQIATTTRYHLKSPYGHIRWFWDLDKEKSTAYLPSNCAHCHIQTGLLLLDQIGALERFEAVNFTHDALWYHCPDALVSECLEQTKRVFERESDVLINRWGAFQCNSDAEIGPDLAHMHTV